MKKPLDAASLLAKANELFWLAFTAGSEQGRDICANNGEVLGFLVLFKPLFVLGWIGHVGEDSLYRAFWQTRIAVDAGVGIYEQTVGQFVKGLDRAYGRAVGIFTLDTWRRDDISHL
jgi:hypothetical protein